MEFCHAYPFVTFVVLTVDQFVGRGDGPLEPQKKHIATFAGQIRVSTT